MVPEEETGEKFSIVGTRQARYDANLKVSGSAVFGTDIRLPNMLYGKIFRSTVAHAKVVKLDLSKAESYPGVRAAVTAKDFPDLTYGFAVRDQTFLPKDRVVYQGQAICAIAADTEEIAEKALAEIEIEYEVLPNVLSEEDALKDDSFPLHPGVTPVGSPPYKSKNVASYTRVHKGNVKRAFETADFTREEEFLGGTPRPPLHIWIKSAVKDGKITARHARAVVDTGAYGSDGAVYGNIACFALIGAYKIPNVETEGISVYTNKQPSGAYRAPGTMEPAFAVESHVDML